MDSATNFVVIGFFSLFGVGIFLSILGFVGILVTRICKKTTFKYLIYTHCLCVSPLTILGNK